MSFLDIINQEQKRLEESNNNEGVKYPETKHKRLYFTKDEPSLLVQILPSADLYSAFAVPTRKVFLTATSSTGKQFHSSFTLDPEPNPAGVLDPKITEWASKGMIPNGFGGQTTPRKLNIVNAVRIVQNPANPQQFVQERDQQGNLVVRVFELPQSAYANLIRKLQDRMYNVSGSEMSFMDINHPSPIKISKPAKGQMEYPVEVYTNIQLPPLGQGWESQLEDLEAQAVPTERLENGLQWVQAFIDMKEGRKPHRHNNDKDSAGVAEPQVQVNPYANVPNPNANVNTSTNQFLANQQAQQKPQPQQFNQNTNPNVSVPPLQQQQQSNTYVAQPQQNQNQNQNQNVNPNQEGTELKEDPLPDMEALLNPNNVPNQPVVPAPNQNVNTNVNNVPPAPKTPDTPAHAVQENGLMNIDAMLEKELGNLG